MLFLLFQNPIFYTIALSPLGRVAEWLNAAVLKTADAQAFVGSNPTPSANHIEPNVFAFGFFFIFFYFFSVILLSISIELPKSQVSFVLFAFISLFLILIIPNAGF